MDITVECAEGAAAQAVVLDTAWPAGLAAGLVPCPACGLPAAVTEWFTLASTDGPVEHIALICVANDFFKMALDRLPADSQAVLRDSRAGGC